ncbi:MAG: replication initiation protein [Desulfovibrionaceae bacterium]
MSISLHEKGNRGNVCGQENNPQRTPQQRFIDSLPERLQWGHGKELYYWGTRASVISKARYLELPTNQWHYLILDIDHEGAGAFWLDEGLPMPTISIVTPDNGHALYFYELANPVLRPINGGASWLKRRPLEFFENIRAGYIKTLCADPGYTAYSCKNPLSPIWEPTTRWHDKQYTLAELAQAVNVPSSRKYRRDIEPDSTSPHAQLFYAGRKWAWENVGSHSSRNAFQAELHSWLKVYYAEHVRPNLQKEIGPHLISSQAQRIAVYTWGKRGTRWLRDQTKNRGVLSLSPVCHRLTDEEKQTEISERQRLGAKYANQARASKTEQAILSAVARLREAGTPLTKAEVAKQAGISKRTVQRHAHLFAGVLDDAA